MEKMTKMKKNNSIESRNVAGPNWSLLAAPATWRPSKLLAQHRLRDGSERGDKGQFHHPPIVSGTVRHCVQRGPYGPHVEDVLSGCILLAAWSWGRGGCPLARVGTYQPPPPGSVFFAYKGVAWFIGGGVKFNFFVVLVLVLKRCKIS